MEMAQAPADWIPPEFREFITEPLTVEAATAIFGTVGFTDEHGHHRHYTVEEIREKFPRITGVRDTRTGEVHPQVSNARFVGGINFSL